MCRSPIILSGCVCARRTSLRLQGLMDAGQRQIMTRQTEDTWGEENPGTGWRGRLSAAAAAALPIAISDIITGHRRRDLHGGMLSQCWPPVGSTQHSSCHYFCAGLNVCAWMFFFSFSVFLIKSIMPIHFFECTLFQLIYGISFVALFFVLFCFLRHLWWRREAHRHTEMDKNEKFVS